MKPRGPDKGSRTSLTSRANKPRSNAPAEQSFSLYQLGITIIQAMDDPLIFGRFFKGDTWGPWKVFLRAAFNLPIEGDDREIYKRQTKREAAPKQCREAWLICGRRAGKSRIVALIAVFLACFKNYEGLFAPGEMGTLMVIGADRKGARVLFRYIRALIKSMPVLEKMVANETRESIELSNDIIIEVQTANFRAVRGYTIVGAVCDEIAFWRDENSANPDIEIVNALRPGMATVPSAMLVALSSPYAQRGAMYDAYERHYGKESEVLVWQAASREMNSSLPQSIVDQAYEEDASSASAEYGARFRKDVEAYVDPELIKELQVTGRAELPFVQDHDYVAFVDPSGGSADSFCGAIAHRNRKTNKIVLDNVIEIRAPFKPSEATQRVADFVKGYGLTRVTGDHYAGEWPSEEFSKDPNGIEYIAAEKSKSEIYREVLADLNSKRVELLDLKRIHTQFKGLERRTTSQGREIIDHEPGTRDDLVNAAAGAIWLLREKVEASCTW